ncbi:MAG: methenyltetrahydrofolate cyclohydrolase [Parcubacteria group bacterium]|nr:methenyltetrahydrofolate cyclohydrolase [Parcubacteria group bacterium]
MDTERSKAQIGAADGRLVAERMVIHLEKEARSRKLHITFVIFNADPATEAFVARKEALAARLGVEVHKLIRTPETTDEAMEIIEELNASDTNGIVIQLPLPEGIDANAVLAAIDPELDVDVLGPEMIRRFKEGETERVPPVAAAVEEILKYYKVPLEGKSVVVLGRGRLVGEPVGMLFEREGIPFTFIDKNTENSEILRLLARADIIISGIGVPHFLKPDMIKDGVVLIDAGTSSDQGKLAGDVDPSCVEKASLMTPVPGGVGPVTVAALFRNLFLK